MTSPHLNTGQRIGDMTQRIGDMALWLFFCAVFAAILSHG